MDDSKLRKMQLTMLSDKLCREIENVKADQLGVSHMVNTRKKLCAGFINDMNVTLVSYSKQTSKKKDYDRFQCV